MTETKMYQKYLENAENCNELAEAAKDAPARARYRRMADAWLALAREQEWLDGEVPPTPSPTDDHGTEPSV